MVTEVDPASPIAVQLTPATMHLVHPEHGKPYTEPSRGVPSTPPRLLVEGPTMHRFATLRCRVPGQPVGSPDRSPGMSAAAARRQKNRHTGGGAALSASGAARATTHSEATRGGLRCPAHGKSCTDATPLLATWRTRHPLTVGQAARMSGGPRRPSSRGYRPKASNSCDEATPAYARRAQGEWRAVLRTTRRA